jgi:GAF domain-containing protein
MTEFEQLLGQLEKQEALLDSEALGSVAGAIAGMFGVQSDEVAVLALNPASRTLTFVLPEKLRAVGSIPLTSTSALAARTARDRRSDIVNNFAISRHASVFEGVPLGRRPSEFIQKLMSAPIVQEDRVIGVVQISRKGESPQDCGPDFKPGDLTALQGLSGLLARFLSLIRAA